MDFGFTLPMRGPLANPADLATLTRTADDLGFGLAGLSDHVILPRATQSVHPYGGGNMLATGDHLETVTTLSFLAGITTRIRLLTSVMVVPHRPPVLTAKALATVDVLSSGRLVLGCGAGWLREEFEALGAPPFDQRGSVTDEYIRIFRELWTAEAPSYQGKYASFSDVQFGPKPAQAGGVPIWIGGESPAALRRAGRLGDGWYPIGSSPHYPLRTLTAMQASMNTVRHHAEAAGRDPAALDFALQANWLSIDEPRQTEEGQRETFTGSIDDITADIQAYQAAGVRHLIFPMVAQTVSESTDRMHRFMDAFGGLRD